MVRGRGWLPLGCAVLIGLAPKPSLAAPASVASANVNSLPGTTYISHGFADTEEFRMIDRAKAPKAPQPVPGREAVVIIKPVPDVGPDIEAVPDLGVAPPSRKAVTEEQSPPREPQPQRYVTLTIGGDLGFGGSRQPVVAGAGVRNGRRHSYASLTRHLRPFVRSDLAFANLETVVTATNKLSAAGKKFNFRMHPAGVAHLVKAGFNVLSTANNHAIDYGSTGIRRTIRHMKALRSEGLVATHGVALTSDDLYRPARFFRNGASFAFAATGIGGPSATATSPGQAHYRRDFKRLTKMLGEARADYRLLSVHYGQELQVRPDKNARAKLAGSAIQQHGVDLVIGHHAHTPAGVQRVDNRLVFYGLGNLLHLGMQNMAKFNECRDFGMLARLHLVSDNKSSGRLVARAIELYALADMHLRSRVRGGANGKRRIEVINYLGAGLDSDRGKGVRFTHRRDGSGLYCVPGAQKLAGAVGELCRDWRPPPQLSTKRRRSLAHACRYMRKSYSSSKVAKLRGSVSPRRKSKRRRSFARAAFNRD